MPSPVRTKGHPDEIVNLQVKVPMWLKLKAVAKAKSEAQSLTDWLRMAIKTAAEEPIKKR